MFTNSEEILDSKMAEKFATWYAFDKKLNNAPLEMSPFESSFLLGVLKKYRPTKILEVGIAAGGTTALILGMLEEIRLDAQLWSVDASERYYRDASKKSGFLALERFPNAPHWHLRAGKILPEFLEEIGGNIHFCIIDTCHVLPGELLDFIAIVPYLAENAIVVLHDTALHLIDTWPECFDRSFATKMVLDTAVGEKILCRDPILDIHIPNIAAIRITSDTIKYISNSFSALTFPWTYMPNNDQLASYKKCYALHYKHDLLEYFDIAVHAQKLAVKKRAQLAVQSSHPHQKHSKTASFVRSCIKNILPYYIVQQIRKRRDRA